MGSPSFTGWTLQDTRGFMVEKASQVHDQGADVSQVSASFLSISLCPPSETCPGSFLPLMVDQIFFFPAPAGWELVLGHDSNNHLSPMCGCKVMDGWVNPVFTSTHLNVTLSNVLLYMLSVLTHHSEVQALSTPYLCQGVSLKPGAEDELWCRREHHGGWCNVESVMAALSLNQDWSEYLLGTEPSEGPGQWYTRKSRAFRVSPAWVPVPSCTA